MNSYDRFNETYFPCKKDCYSQLNQELISDNGYGHFECVETIKY